MTKQKLEQSDFTVETLGDCTFENPMQPSKEIEEATMTKVLYQNEIRPNESIKDIDFLSFESPGAHSKIHFNSGKINVGIVTCGGLCPGINGVIRAITYACIDLYNVKTVFGFRFGYEGLTTEFSKEAVRLSGFNIQNIHEHGGTILGSSRGQQDVVDMVDTLVKFNISILFVVGGDGTHHGSFEMAKEIKRRKLDISIMGIPKTIDNDINFIHKTFGFDTAVEAATLALDRAHVEAKGARNGIGLVKLMGRHSGFIAAHATLASGNVNVCLIPEQKLDMNELYEKVKTRFSKSGHAVIVVAEGVGQELLYEGKEKKYDASGNLALQDIGPYLKNEICKHLSQEKIPHTMKYIDPSYTIRARPANAIDASFCLRLGNYAVHAAMAGRTNCLVGYWNQHFTLVPISLALNSRKEVDPNSPMWKTIEEITA